MMKKLLFLGVIICLISCNTENGWDCIQTEGLIIQEEVNVQAFEKLIVNRDIQLFVKQGAEQEIILETGENLVNDIDFQVVNDQLQISDNNSCNLIRPYGITKVYITMPDLKVIRNSSQYEITSLNILNYNNIKLISEDFNLPGSFTVGDFRLEVNTNVLTISSNNISSFYISGETNNLSVSFFSGAGRFEGENLIAENVEIFHRGSNDMIVNPQESLTGELRGTGDLISINQPPLVNIEQFYIGQLIFQD